MSTLHRSTPSIADDDSHRQLTEPFATETEAESQEVMWSVRADTK